MGSQAHGQLWVGVPGKAAGLLVSPGLVTQPTGSRSRRGRAIPYVLHAGFCIKGHLSDLLVKAVFCRATLALCSSLLC